MSRIDIFAPLQSLQWVDRTLLKPNGYNPNKVSEENLRLLMQSIITNGWTLPIVVRPDYTIIDGYHRWVISGREPLIRKLNGRVPVVTVAHDDPNEDVYGTVTHNRARGTHLPDESDSKAPAWRGQKRKGDRKTVGHETRRGIPPI